MTRQYPIYFTDGVSVSMVCEWYVSKYDLPCTAEQFYNASPTGDRSHVAAAAQLCFAELSKMDARLTVDPRFTFDVDVTALVKLDQVLTFFRNSHPTSRDADIEQLSILIKTTLSKVKEYDDALRGLSVSTSRSEILPSAEDTPSPAANLPPAAPPANPAAPQGPPQGFPTGAPAVQARPPGAPPPNVIGKPGQRHVHVDHAQGPSKSAPGPSHPPEETSPEMDLGAAVRPPESGAPVPGAPPPNVTEDQAVRALTPPDSGARMPGGAPPTQKPPEAAPGAPPVPGGFAPPGAPAAPSAEPSPPAAASGGPPANEEQVPPPATPPANEEQVPPSVAPGTPPPPNPEF